MLFKSETKMTQHNRFLDDANESYVMNFILSYSMFD